MVMTVLRRMDPWLPPLLLMGVIFALSAQPNLSTDLGIVDRVGRKFVHASEYALLCLLWWRALRTVAAALPAIAGAWAISAAYAVSDEIHQRFVGGRQSTWVDVTIDVLGAALAATLIVRSQREASPR
jgi:VanZ family protein